MQAYFSNFCSPAGRKKRLRAGEQGLFLFHLAGGFFLGVQAQLNGGDDEGLFLRLQFHPLGRQNLQLVQSVIGVVCVRIAALD